MAFFANAIFTSYEKNKDKKFYIKHFQIFFILFIKKNDISTVPKPIAVANDVVFNATLLECNSTEFQICRFKQCEALR